MKKLLSILLCAILVLSVGAVAMAEEKEYTKVTILYDSTCTETSTSGIGSQIIVDYIQDNSNGAVTVDAHSNYSLFPQDQIIPAVMSGQLGMSATTAAYMADYMPKLKVLASAYLFSGYDHWKAYYSSQDWLDLTDEIAAETGIRVIGVSNKGGRTINLKEDQQRFLAVPGRGAGRQPDPGGRRRDLHRAADRRRGCAGEPDRQHPGHGPV